MTRPRRIVSLVPSTTESVHALGVGDRLVGCTRWCTEPGQDLAAVPRLGGTKNPDREAIAALAPDLVLGNAEENRPEDLDWLGARFPVLVQTPCDVIAAAHALRELATRLGDGAAATPWLHRIESWLVAAAAERQRRALRRACYVIWRRPWMSIARSTFVHDVLATVGLTNVCADAAVRYPEFDPDVVRESGVDCVLLASEPWVFDETQRRELAAARVFGDARLLVCDGRDFCWHGVRMADGLGRALALAGSLGD
jgi:ABC-type Fe3+-hydroxamate transport system substrate-binding protein